MNKGIKTTIGIHYEEGKQSLYCDLVKNIQLPEGVSWSIGMIFHDNLGGHEATVGNILFKSSGEVIVEIETMYAGTMSEFVSSVIQMEKEGWKSTDDGGNFSIADAHMYKPDTSDREIQRRGL